ncbi:MAG: 1-acyl-sn-glycerol-3-phosphate acyltransferase [Planctomycetota bacterium]|jgi:1-acyl-sn-glycerol-3-phosphate acyltransferase|nr:1-acyl-sn-glycerol-3-phosphate acyltransferase [Planctomycetota bacterium]
MGERFYRFSQWCVRWLFDVLGGLEVAGCGNVPGEGPLIVAANHASYFDPMLLGAAINRPLHFMARRTLFDIPGFGWLIRQNQAFPLERGGDSREALRGFGELLGQGHAVVVFPEGTRTRDGAIGDIRPGVGMLSERYSAPILPVYIWGTFQSLPRGRLVPRFHRFKALIGPPLRQETEEGYRKRKRQRLTDAFRSTIRALEREAWRDEQEVPPVSLLRLWSAAGGEGTA